MKRVGIVGMGLIGRERLQAIQTLQDRRLPVCLAAVIDPFVEDLGAIVKPAGAVVHANLEDFSNAKLDLAIVAVPHQDAVSISKTLLKSGITVLLEKPLGRDIAEANEILAACSKKSQLYVGQNYRFMPGVSTLLEDIHNNRFGNAIGLSLVLGHGGKPEDKTSWKLDKEKAGGGVLIDPGIHLIDLCRLAAHKVEPLACAGWSGFWQTGIEEECRIVMRSDRIPMIDLTVSIVRWRSTFRLEFFGDAGYGVVQGRGRSYGIQEYRRGARWGWQSGQAQAESEELVVTSPCQDTFADEIAALLFPDAKSKPHPCTAEEAIENMSILEQLRNLLQQQQI